MKKILITAPLRQDIDIFQEYQKGLDALEVPEGYEVSRFFVVNDCREVVPYIICFRLSIVLRTSCQLRCSE